MNETTAVETQGLGTVTQPQAKMTVTEKTEVSLTTAGGFDTMWRVAKALATSDLIPDIFKGKPQNVMIALELSSRLGVSAMAVMQNLYIVHGKPGWSATFIIGAVNACGKYSPLRFKITGEKADKTCVAWASELATGELLEGPPVSIKMADDEGWLTRKGSKWQTMPELMLRYRAATFFGRLYAPELLMGMKSEEEIKDITPQAGEVIEQVVNEQKGLNGLKAKLDERKEEAKPATKDFVDDLNAHEGEFPPPVEKTNA